MTEKEIARKEGVAQRVADLDGGVSLGCLGSSVELDRISLMEEEYAR